MHWNPKLLASLFFLFFLLVSLGHAQQQTLFNFGTMQEGRGVVASPGDNITLNMYFFQDEQYGNRITHVIANIDTAPPGWVVQVTPPVGTTHLNVSGILVDSEENLYVTPRPVLPSIPENKEEGIFYLKSPSGKGYLQAKRLQAIVRIPASAELGKTYTVKLTADGFWFGSAGNIALKQSRAFAYDVLVAKKEYTEQVLPEKAPEKAAPVPQPQGLDMNQVLVYVLGAAVVIMFVYILASRKKK